MGSRLENTSGSPCNSSDRWKQECPAAPSPTWSVPCKLEMDANSLRSRSYCGHAQQLESLGDHADVLEVLPDRKSTRLNSSHQIISYAVFCLKKKKKINISVTYKWSHLHMQAEHITTT